MEIKTQFWVEASLDDVWNFHSDVHNLKVISPEIMNIKWITEPRFALHYEFEMQSQFSFLPIKQNWRLKFMEIHEEGNERYFVDEALKSPFKSWRHKHSFKTGVQDQGLLESAALPNAGTWITDEVSLELNPVSQLTQPIVQKFMNYFFLFRQKQILQHFSK